MDKISKAISESMDSKMQEWKRRANLTDLEADIFYLREFCQETTLQISLKLFYSQRQIQRIYRDARDKILKIL